MILGALTANGDNRTTLDDLFRRAAIQRPNTIALSDPPNRNALTGQRLAGSTPEAASTQANLIAGGHNPLIAHAFRPCGTPPAT